MELNSIYQAETVATVIAHIKWSVYNIKKKASVFTVISEFKQHRSNFHVSLIGIIFNLLSPYAPWYGGKKQEIR